jgi:hypothetical protein
MKGSSIIKLPCREDRTLTNVAKAGFCRHVRWKLSMMQMRRARALEKLPFITHGYRNQRLFCSQSYELILGLSKYLVSVFHPQKKTHKEANE